MSSAVRAAGAPADVPKSLVTAIFGPEAGSADPLAAGHVVPDRRAEASDVRVRYTEHSRVSYLLRRQQRASMEFH